jgi:hypothetical protein
MSVRTVIKTAKQAKKVLKAIVRRELQGPPEKIAALKAY